MTKPKDILKLYLALFILGAIFYYTLGKQKDGNIRANRENYKGKHQNQSYKLEN